VSIAASDGPLSVGPSVAGPESVTLGPPSMPPEPDPPAPGVGVELPVVAIGGWFDEHAAATAVAATHARSMRRERMART
jgi:hypothetical protein